jgi:hypothetical protein
MDPEENPPAEEMAPAEMEMDMNDAVPEGDMAGDEAPAEGEQPAAGSPNPDLGADGEEEAEAE